MKRKTFLLLGLFSLLAWFMPVSMQAADSINDLKASMSQRRSAIDNLLIAQKVGENKEGYLSVLENLTPDEKKLVQDENDDRRAIYTAIAQKSGGTPAGVGALRAGDIRNKAKNGIKVQKPDGSWMVK